MKKAYILVDETKVVRCMASKEANLHKDKLTMKKYHVDVKGTVGDKYEESNDTWELHPENYPEPTKLQIEDIVVILVKQRERYEILEDELEADYSDEINDITDLIADWKEIYDEMESYRPH